MMGGIGGVGGAGGAAMGGLAAVGEMAAMRELNAANAAGTLGASNGVAVTQGAQAPEASVKVTLSAEAMKALAASPDAGGGLSVTTSISGAGSNGSASGTEGVCAHVLHAAPPAAASKVDELIAMLLLALLLQDKKA